MNWRLFIYSVHMNMIGGVWFPCPYLPGADAFSHGDDVTKAGRGFYLCSRTHRHGNKFLCQSVAYLYEGNQYLDEPISKEPF